jgi:hypothetical protein
MITDVENLARDPFFTMGTIRNQPGGDEHDVYPAGQLLVDFENLSNGAVLPVGGECASVLELEAVLEDPLACCVECRDEFLRADDEDDVRGAPGVGGELASRGGGDHACSLKRYGVDASEREIGLAGDRFHLLLLGLEVERQHLVADRLVGPAAVDRGFDTGLLERHRGVRHHGCACWDAREHGFAGSVEIIDDFDTESVLFERNDCRRERLVVGQRREAVGCAGAHRWFSHGCRSS